VQLGTFSKNSKKAQGAEERRGSEEKKEKKAKGVGGNPFAALEDGEKKVMSARELQARIIFYLPPIPRWWLYIRDGPYRGGAMYGMCHIRDGPYRGLCMGCATAQAITEFLKKKKVLLVVVFQW